MIAKPGGLALQQLFPYKSSYFFLISNLHKMSFFNARVFKLGRFDVFDMGFPFLAFLKLQPIILWKSRSRDGLAAKYLFHDEQVNVDTQNPGTEALSFCHPVLMKVRRAFCSGRICAYFSSDFLHSRSSETWKLWVVFFKPHALGQFIVDSSLCCFLELVHEEGCQQCRRKIPSIFNREWVALKGEHHALQVAWGRGHGALENLSSGLWSLWTVIPDFSKSSWLNLRKACIVNGPFSFHGLRIALFSCAETTRTKSNRLSVDVTCFVGMVHSLKKAAAPRPY